MRRVLLAALALVTFGACKVDVSVGVDAHRDGTGEVRVTAVLDKAAVERMDDLDAELRTDDLKKAGWTVEAPKKVDGGGLSQTIRHRFANPQEAGKILDQLAGGSDAAAAPLREFALAQDRSFFRTNTRFRGTVDLARGIDAFSDPRLQQSLGGQPLGATTEQLQEQLGASFDRIFGLQIAVRMPGSVDANAPTVTDNGAVWAPKLGERIDITADAGAWNVRNIVLLAISVGAALALVAVVLVRRLSSDEASPVDV